MSVTQILTGASTGNLSAILAGHFSPLDGQMEIQSTMAAGEFLVGADGTLQNLYLKLGTAPGAGKSYTFAVLINGSASGITITISDTATSGSDTTHTAAVVKGDRVTVKSTPSGTPATTTVKAYLEQVNTTTGESYNGNMRNLGMTTNSSANRYFSPLGARSAYATTGQALMVIPLIGSMTEWRISLSGSPGSGKSYSFVIFKNGVAQDGTSGTPNTTITIADAATSGSATFTLPLAVADVLYARAVPTGTPTLRQITQTVTLVADRDGVFLWPVSGGVNASVSATRYNHPRGWDVDWNATESNVQFDYIGPSPIRFTAIGLVVEQAPGTSKSFALTLRTNTTPLPITVTLAGSATSAVAADLFGVIESADLLSLSLVPTGTPAVPISTNFALAIAPDPIRGTAVFGVTTTVTASRAIAFGVDGNVNVHNEAGKVKVFGDFEVTGETTLTGGVLMDDPVSILDTIVTTSDGEIVFDSDGKIVYTNG